MVLKCYPYWMASHFSVKLGVPLLNKTESHTLPENGAPPQKVYGSTRSLNNASFSVSSLYDEEQVQITDITGSSHQTVNLKEDNTLEQTEQRSVPVPNRSQGAVFTRVSGNKLIHRLRSGLTGLVNIRTTDGIDYAARSNVTRYGFDGSLVNAENIANYTFFLTSTKKLYIGNGLYIDFILYYYER